MQRIEGMPPGFIPQTFKEQAGRLGSRRITPGFSSRDRQSRQVRPLSDGCQSGGEAMIPDRLRDLLVSDNTHLPCRRLRGQFFQGLKRPSPEASLIQCCQDGL